MISLKKVFPNILIIFLLVYAGSAGFSQTKKEKNQWKKCQKKIEKSILHYKKIEILEKFIEKYPDNFYTNEAREKISEIAYEKLEYENKRVSNEDLIKSLYKFIERYPESKMASIAKNRIQTLKDLKIAEAKNTVEAYEDFIKKHPDYKYAKWAESKIRYISWANTTIKELIGLIADNGLDGEFRVDKSIDPLNEIGIYKSDDFDAIVTKSTGKEKCSIVRLYLLLQKESQTNLSLPEGKNVLTFRNVTRSNETFGVDIIYEFRGKGKYYFEPFTGAPSRMRNHTRVCRNIDSKKDKILYFHRADPFIICAILKKSSLKVKIDEIFDVSSY